MTLTDVSTSVFGFPQFQTRFETVNKIVAANPEGKEQIRSIAHTNCLPPRAITHETILLSSRHLSPGTINSLNEWARAFEVPPPPGSLARELLDELDSVIKGYNPFMREWLVKAVNPDIVSKLPETDPVPRDLRQIQEWLYRNNISIGEISSFSGNIVNDLPIYDEAPPYRGASINVGDRITVHFGEREE